MNLKFLLLFFLSTATTLSANSQNAIRFSGTLDTLNLNEIVLFKYGVRENWNFDSRIDISLPIDSCKNFNGEFYINEMGFYMLGDLHFGHMIFLRPGDSIFISLIKNPDSVRERERVYYTLEPKSKYPLDITFFDTLRKVFGMFKRYNVASGSPEKFFAGQLALYNKKIALLNDYQSLKLVSDDFVKYAMVELKSQYITGTGDAFGFISYSSLTDDLLKLPFTFDFNDSLMAVSTRSFQNAASVYNYYFLNKYDGKESSTFFKPLYHSASVNFTGYVRELLQGNILSHFARENSPDFDSLYYLFLNNSKNIENKSSVANRLREIREEQNRKKVANNKVSITFSQVTDQVEIQDMKGRIQSIRTLFSDSKITLIDCWASWCYPCIVQIPFLNKIKKLYNDRVNFVNLSFDKEVDKWESSVKQNNTDMDYTKDFLLSGEFSSKFAKYFNLESIPRYILISKNGLKVLDDDMPSPSKETDFIKILEKHLN